MTIMNFSCISKGMPSQTTILAIETSCDETGVALVRKVGEVVRIVSHVVASQIDIHAKTGGVVPEVAAREHVAVIKPLLEQVMADSGLDAKDITAIAVTVGPGLQPALAVGCIAAKTLAFAWGKPVVPVHHLEGHVYSALLADNDRIDVAAFPALALIVSGGHTMLVSIPSHLTYEIIGSTVDDAAGEAFDKVARLLGLGYPGGPALSILAAQGNPRAFAFPRPMIGSADLKFSFSGLKTAVLYAWRALSEAEKAQSQADVAASFEAAVVDTLIRKTEQAIQSISPKTLLLTGGVAANRQLRQTMAVMAAKYSIPFKVAPLELSGDNAAMIGQAAVYAFESGRRTHWRQVDAKARLNLNEFTPDRFPQLLQSGGVPPGSRVSG